MTLTQEYNRIVRLTWTSWVYSVENFLEDLNKVKNRFWAKVVARLDEDRHYQEWTIDWWTIALQSEYTLASVSTSTEWTKVLKWVLLNYNWETYEKTWLLKYVKATEVNRQTLAHEWNYYLENQSEDEPIYFVADNSIFIAPVPTSTTAGAERLKLIWIRNIVDYTIDTTEDEMIIPIDEIEVLMLWVIPYALKTKRAEQWEILKAEQEYKTAEIEALQTMSARVEWPIFMNYPTTQTDDIILNRR